MSFLRGIVFSDYLIPMKIVMAISIVVLGAGLLLKDRDLSLHIYDTYLIISYIYVAVILIVLLNSIFLIVQLLKKLLRR